MYKAGRIMCYGCLDLESLAQDLKERPGNQMRPGHKMALLPAGAQ